MSDAFAPPDDVVKALDKALKTIVEKIVKYGGGGVSFCHEIEGVNYLVDLSIKHDPNFKKLKRKIQKDVH